jgi:hypothetical protein
MNNKKFFSPNFMAEFKKWMSENQDSKNSFVKGQHVYSGAKLKHIVETIDCLDVGENAVLDVSKYFIKHGGVVKEVNGDQVTIKNKKGTFILSNQDLVSQ